MGLTYFKRFRMEIDLQRRLPGAPPLPTGYDWLGWDPALLQVHAQTKFLSFRSEIDANVFPCLGDQAGCLRLMGEITGREGFLPCATWLAVFRPQPGASAVYCGTIQGLRDPAGFGAVQNLGVVPGHRGFGLGRSLLIKSLIGFRDAGLCRAFLEVTAQNASAIRLYHELGFRKARTLYKAVDLAYS